MHTPSAVFVPTTTPHHSVQEDSVESNANTSNDITQIDILETSPEIDLRLLAWKLLFYALTTLLFYGAFTVVAYSGIVVETVYEPIGSSKKAEGRLEIYNTYSGYVMAFTETIVRLYMDKFMPVLDVYVHNALYFLHQGNVAKDPRTGKLQPSVRMARKIHQAILFCFPILLALTMGNSLRGFQAGQSSDGFKRVMIVDDLKKEQPALELIKNANDTNGESSGFKALSTQDTILKNAIRGKSVPFSFNTKTPCGIAGLFGEYANLSIRADIDIILNSNKNNRTLHLNVHELDATSVVYGFPSQEWNREAIPHALKPTSTFRMAYKQVDAANTTLQLPPEFSLSLAYEMLVQGKVLIERAHGNAVTGTYPCSQSDNGDDNELVKPVKVLRPSPETEKRELSLFYQRRLHASDDETDDSDHTDGKDQWTHDKKGVRLCEGAVSSLFDMEDFYQLDHQSLENLMVDTINIFNTTLDNLSIEETEINFEKYDLTEQIHIDAMAIDIPINTTVDYGFFRDYNETQIKNGRKPIYSYLGLQESFCGSDSCAFLDASDSMKMQRRIGVTSYVVNCSLHSSTIHYSADFRGFFPDHCTKIPNAAFVYGIGSYITGDEYGSIDTTPNSSAPYIIAPRRHLRFSFAKVTWQTEDLALTFNAKCGNDQEKPNCNGLWYQLKPSNRFLFAGDDALPIDKLDSADFRSPIALVQLNSPSLYVETENVRVTLESLTPSRFKRVKWNTNEFMMRGPNGTSMRAQAALYGSNCSVLVDSYLRQLSDNNYVIEDPMQIMYTSFFYYLMQNAAVTELNDTKLAINAMLNGNRSVITLSKSEDKLGNVKLKGDLQVRSVRVSIPRKSFKTTLAGCILVLVLIVIVLFVRVRRVQHFDARTSRAQEFVAMRSDTAYPDSVHTKTLFFPVTNEIVPFDEIEIETMVLVHKTQPNKKIVL